MDAQNAHQRIMDSAAVGPQQFTIDQRTYIDHMQHYGRTDPMPPEFGMSRVFKDDQGTWYHEDLWPDDEQGWAIPDGSFGREFEAVSP